jgi:hypothetical protein
MQYTWKEIQDMSPVQLAEANQKMTRQLIITMLAFAAVKYLLIRTLTKPWHAQK